MSDLKQVEELREAFHQTTAAILTHGHARDIIAALRERGMVIVPSEPTKAMVRAGHDKKFWYPDDVAGVYRAMIAASAEQERKAS